MIDSKKILIMLGGPSDVQEELKLAKEVIDKWNQTHFKSEFSLQAIDWENNTYPALGNHPQKEINNQITTPSDILVCVLGGKLGTQTDTHPSGTIEEIEEHINAGKPVMIFFRKQNEITDASNISDVLKYKKSLSSKCLWRDFNNTNCFKDCFRDAFEQFINDYIAKQDDNLAQISDKSFCLTPVINRLTKQINEDIIAYESLGSEIHTSSIYERGEKEFAHKKKEYDNFKIQIINNGKLLQTNLLSQSIQVSVDIHSVSDVKKLIDYILNYKTEN